MPQAPEGVHRKGGVLPRVLVACLRYLRHASGTRGSASKRKEVSSLVSLWRASGTRGSASKRRRPASCPCGVPQVPEGVPQAPEGVHRKGGVLPRVLVACLRYLRHASSTRGGHLEGDSLVYPRLASCTVALLELVARLRYPRRVTPSGALTSLEGHEARLR